MFVGNNTLKLNRATLIVALQEYLDKRTVGDHVKVVSVQKGIAADVFDVDVTEVEKVKK